VSFASVGAKTPPPVGAFTFQQRNAPEDPSAENWAHRKQGKDAEQRKGKIYKM